MLNKLKAHKRYLHEALITNETNFIFDSILTFFVLLLAPLLGIIMFPYYLFIWLFTGIVSIFSWFNKSINKGKEHKRVKAIVDAYEQRILKDGLLSLEGFAPEFNNFVLFTYSDFIYYFIKLYNYTYNTLDSSNNITCRTNRRRSIGDIYLITKFYFPEVTLEKVVERLYIMCERQDIQGHYCRDICKFVFKNAQAPTRYDEKVDKNTPITFEKLIDYYNIKL